MRLISTGRRRYLGWRKERRPNPGRFRSYLIMLFAAQRGRGVLLWLGAMLFVHAAHAATPVSVQLVLAVDVSGSVSQDRFELQRAGYAAAFRDPAVAQAIRSTSTGSIAVAILQWTGPALHVVAAEAPALQEIAQLRRAICRGDRAGAARAVRRRHLDQRSDRLCTGDDRVVALPG